MLVYNSAKSNIYDIVSDIELKIRVHFNKFYPSLKINFELS